MSMKAYKAKGVLLTCDPAVKEILVAMDAESKFIITILDDNHVVVQADQLERVRQMLEEELEKNTYSLEA